MKVEKQWIVTLISFVAMRSSEYGMLYEEDHLAYMSITVCHLLVVMQPLRKWDEMEFYL